MNNNMKKPNMVFILVDDHGQWALNTYGNKEVISPNIDQLAKEGMRFDNFFCTSPVCSPARASILTGKMPSQHGVQDWLKAGAVGIENMKDARMNLKRYLEIIREEARIELLAGRTMEEIDPEETICPLDTAEGIKFMTREKDLIHYLENQETYSEVLNRNGYECGLVGKWHLGDAIHKQCGFDTWFMAGARGATKYTYAEVIEDGKISYKDEYVTKLITDHALCFLDKQSSEKPFYLSVHYTAPHDPWEKDDQPEEFWNMYENCEFKSIPDTEINPNQNPHVFTIAKTREKAEYLARGYFTSITAMDHYIGEIRKKLAEQNLDDNTIIVYCGDNGMNFGHHGIWGKGNATLPQNVYDTSVKVPFIWFDPRKELDKKVNENLLSQYDIMPTIYDVCGIDKKLDESFPGKSFAKLFDNATIPEEDVVVYDEYGPTRMIRGKEYKYVHRYPVGPHEFYQIAKDPMEEKNLIDHPEFQELISEYRQKLETWFIKYSVPERDGALLGCAGSGQFNLCDRTLGLGEVFEKAGT